MMNRSILFAAFASFSLVIAGACGSSPDTPADGPRLDAGRPPDSSSPDASPDAALDGPRPIDAAPDSPPPIDMDHDGHPVDADCDDADPAVWQTLAYSFRDADGDQHTVPMAGTICTGDSLPPGYSTVAAAPDCDDTDPAVFTALVGFADTDGDGFGTGMAVPLCTAGSLPTGYAPTGDDCAPEDAAHWIDRLYSFRDADGDGAAIAEAGTVCSGDALPPGYLVSAPVGRPLDCNDTDPAVSVALTVFTDVDGDHVGAGTGQLVCTSGAAPPGSSTSGTDCDDTDPAIFVSLVYTAVDFDADTFTVPAMGTRCTGGALLPPFFDTPHGNDCDDADPAVWALLTYHGIDEDRDGFTVPASGDRCTSGTLPPPFEASEHGNDCDDGDPALTHFAVLYPDQDRDGVGAPPRQVHCLGNAAPPPGLTFGGYDEDDTDPSVIETDDFDDLLDLIVLGG